MVGYSYKGILGVRKWRSTHKHGDVIWRVFGLCKSHESFQALDVLARLFIIEYVSDLGAEDLFTARSRVDTNGSRSNRPGRIANGQLEIGIVGLPEIPLLHGMHNLGDAYQHVGGKVLVVQA